MALPARNAPTLAAALEYAARGWPAIPLHAPVRSGCSCGDPACERGIGKHPRIDAWQLDASTDTAVINGWWTRWPNSNVGLLTGKRAGFIVLDVDPDSGGDESLAALERAHATLPETQTSRTGSGGSHFLFTYPGTIVKNSVAKIAPGLDIRGDGGQIAAPPSLHRSGKTYRWITETELAPAPEWLLDLLREEPRTPAGPAPQRRGPTDVLERCSRYIARMPPAISGSCGHDALWAVALVAVRGFQLTTDEAYSLIASEYNPRCLPEWTERELRHKISDAFTKSTLPWGYLLNKPAPAPTRKPAPQKTDRPEPGCDDGDDSPAVHIPRFALEPLSKFLVEVIPPTKWLLSPYVPAGSFGELVGPPGKGKTTFMASMLMQMAANGYRCAIIEEEGSRGGLQRLLRRALEAINKDVAERIWFSHAQHVNLLDQADIYDLSIVLRGFDFVLFDSFNLVTPGLEEDKAKEMGTVIRDLRWLRDTLQIAAWLNHHSGKSKWKPGEIPRLGDGRGSSVLPGALDTELSMRPVENPEEGFIQFDLFVTKMREADDQIKPQRISIARNGPAAIVQMYDTDAEVAPLIDGALLLDVLRFVDAAGAAGTSKNQLEKNVTGKTDAIRDALMALKASGRVEEISVGAYSRWRTP